MPELDYWRVPRPAETIETVTIGSESGRDYWLRLLASPRPGVGLLAGTIVPGPDRDYWRRVPSPPAGRDRDYHDWPVAGPERLLAPSLSRGGRAGETTGPPGGVGGEDPPRRVRRPGRGHLDYCQGQPASADYHWVRVRVRL